MKRVLVGLLAAVGCGDDPGPADGNPLGTGDNILPYPSSLYERADASSPTGIRLDVPSGALPVPDSGAPFDPARINLRTGWPAALTILWTAPGGVDPATLVPFSALDRSVTTDSSTVIVDMMTGELIPHFAEVDANELDDFDRQAVYLRPAERLAGGHRFAVGIRRSVMRRDGSALPISRGFRAVLDDDSTGHKRLDAARPRLREAVDAIDAAGVPKSDLLVAWDFTVADDATAMIDPLAARDAALAAMGPLGANLGYAITSDQGTVNGDPRIARRVEIDFDTPSIAEEHLGGYHRDDAGNVIARGTAKAHAYIAVPPCATAATPAGILIYGHGFFGNLDEIRNAEYVRQLSADGCLITAGTLWVGMSTDDISDALLALNDLSHAFGFGEHIWQGIVNFIALEQMLRGKLATELLVDAQGHSIVDPTRVYYLGISQGHILGSTFFAYEPFIDRGVLHVGGANWSLMFERSNNWAIYGMPLKGAYEHLLEADIMEQVLEMGLEQVDGATVAPVAVPGTPAKHTLMNTSLGDAQVPNLASFFQARSLGAKLVEPAVAEPFGIDHATTVDTGAALVIVDEHPTPLPPDTNETFSYDNVAHEHPRRRAAIQQLMLDFWRTGVVANPCTGTCDCAAGNCGDLRTAMYGGT